MPANATMARQLFLFDAEALRAADEGAGALQRLAGRGVKVPRGLACSAANAFRVLPTLRGELFDIIDSNPYASLKADNIVRAINDNDDVAQFKSRFYDAFDDVDGVNNSSIIVHVFN